MKKCGKACTACPYVQQSKNVKIYKKDTWEIGRQVDCNTYNCIYMIQCQKDKCGEKYIGQTERIMKFWIADHISYISNQVIARGTGAHFNLPGHSLADMKYTVIEQVRYNNESYRKERETYHINKFNTFYKGINREA